MRCLEGLPASSPLTRGGFVVRRMVALSTYSNSVDDGDTAFDVSILWGSSWSAIGGKFGGAAKYWSIAWSSEDGEAANDDRAPPDSIDKLLCPE